MDAQWTTAVTQVGFPIVITFWFMFRFEKRWDRILELMTQEAEILRDIHEHINKGGRND